MDINRKFEKILIKNKIIKEISYDKAVEIIQYLEKRVIEGDRIGIYGVGIEAEGLLRFISRNTSHLKIDACFDKTIRNYEYKEIVRDNTVYSIEQIKDMNIDYIIIGSYAYREVFAKKLSALGYNGRIVDLYSYMNEYMEGYSTDYQKAYRARQTYLKASKTNKAETLRKLIKEYLLLKDFQYSFHYIDIYVENKYLGYERYIKLKDDINLLLKEIREHMARRNKRDIIINWVDALSYYDMPKFPFLQEKASKGVCFHNAYTVMPWTTETTKIMLYGEYPIEGRLFLRNTLTVDNVKLLKMLAEHGYKFAYCGMPKFAKLFDDTIMAPVSYFGNKYNGSMQKQWDALVVLCESNSPICALIHTFKETHEPFICGECDTLNWYGSTENDWAKKECRHQAEVSGKYMNTQLEFYESLYPKDAIEIYMSDHGRVGNNPMNEKKVHIMLTVSGKGIKPSSVNGMFSLVRFPDLLKILLEKDNNWSELESEYVIIENLDAYGELIVKDTLSGKLNREEMCQCRGIITMRDRYFLYAYGKEFYFLSGKSGQNEIENPLYKSRVMELKELCKEDFINIFKYEKFNHSRQLYTEVDLDLNKFNFI